MRGNIQFAKIDVKNRSRLKQTALVFFGVILLSIISIFSVLSVKAYFTATSNREGELHFGEISVALVNSSGGTITADNFKTSYLTNILPGSTLNFTNITVKNTGDFNEYVLLNVDVTITPKSGTALHYNEWYNIDGYKVNNHNFAINSAEASLLAKDASATTNIKWTIPGEVVTDTYQKGTTAVTITAYGTQTNLPEANAYQNIKLYASYFICKNATTISSTSLGKNLFDMQAADEYQQSLIDSGIALDDYSMWITEYDGKTCLYMHPGSMYDSGVYYHFPINAKPNTQYTLSYKGFMESMLTANDAIETSETTGLAFVYSDGGMEYGPYMYNQNTSWQEKTLTSQAGRTVVGVYLLYWRGNYAYFADIQIEEGTVATAYTPYSEPATYSGTTAINDPLRAINGKNLFYASEENVWEKGANVEYLENGVRLISKSSGTGTFNGVKYEVADIPAGTQVTLKANYTSSASNTGKLFLSLWDHVTREHQYIVNLESSGASGTGIIPEKTNENQILIVMLYINSSGTVAVGDTTTYTNIQLEIGSTATTYEAYNGARDVMDFTAQTTTRNVGKVEFTGDEAGWDLYNYGNEGISFSYANLNAKKIGYKTSICSHFTNIDDAWGTNHKNDQGIYSDHPNTVNLYFRVPTGRADIDTLAEWKAWLKEQYEAGHPVTVWYKLTTPVTEKFFASKNLYDGEQYFNYETGSTSNKIESSGKIFISQGATKDLNKQVMELGGDLFDYLKNKPITISCKIKIYPDDTRTNNRITISYKKDASVSESFKVQESVRNTIPKDGEWHYYSVSVDAFTNYISSTTNGQITLWFTDYSSYGEKAHFAITDLQIEVGTAPTEFENYDQTVYARVNDVELRQIDTTKDTYNASTKTITRRVAKTELKTNIDYYVFVNEDANYATVFTNDHQLGLMSAPAPVTAGGLRTILCSHLPYLYSNVGYLKRTEEGIMGWGDGTASFMMTVKVTRFNADVQGFKAWVEQQAYQGKPVTVWYEVQNPTTETLS